MIPFCNLRNTEETFILALHLAVISEWDKFVLINDHEESESEKNLSIFETLPNSIFGTVCKWALPFARLPRETNHWFLALMRQFFSKRALALAMR